MAEIEPHRLRQWREQNGFSQEALAGLLGVDDVTVSRWELERTEPQRRHWPKIKEVTGLSRAQFLGLEPAQ